MDFLAGNNVVIDATISSDGGDVNFNAVAGTATVNAAIDSALGNVDGDAGTAISLNAPITTTGGDVSLTSPSILISTPVTISTGSAAGDIAFTGPVNSDVNETNNLTLNAGTGDILFTAAVGSGANQELGDILVTSAANITANSSIAATSVTQAAGTGATTFNGSVTTSTPAGISVTTNDVNVNGNLIARSTVGTGESISLTAVNDITVGAGVTEISTREGGTDASDMINIAADSDVNGNGTVSFPNHTGFSISTDGGIAKRFAARPSGGAADTAFFGFTSNPIVASTVNSEISALEYLSEWQIIVGVDGEENLRVEIDWRDPSGGGGMTDPLLATSERLQTFDLDGDSTNPRTIGHIYSIDDFTVFSQANIAIFEVDFAVSHHESIAVTGHSIIQPPGQPGAVAVASRVLSSTDDPNTGSNTIDPLTDVTDLVASNLDLHFDNGTLEVRVPTQLPFAPPIEYKAPEPSPPPSIAAPPVSERPVFVAAAEATETPFTSYSSQSEDYFQIRKGSNEPEEGYEHIEDDVGWKLLQPKRLKQWVSEQDFNGTGYELWLITTKVKNGQDVTFERPVLKFDVFDQQPFPMEEPLEQMLPELRLVPIEVDEDGNVIPSETSQDEIDNADTGAGGSEEESKQLEGQQLLIPVETGKAEPGLSPTAQSAMAGLTLSQLLGRKKKQDGPKPHISILNRVLRSLDK